MDDNPLTDAVAQQYERWPYPKPATELSKPKKTNSYLFYFPAREYWNGVEILVAGCGSNQAAQLALGDPSAKVLGIDVSEASLANQRRLKEKHGLANLELRRLPIEQVGEIGREFDLIFCDGVLHHLADPVMGAKALARCLRPGGAIEIMLYAKYGRFWLESIQAVCRVLGLGRDEASVALVRDLLSRLPAGHPIHSATKQFEDKNYDAGLVDLFLNARERHFTVADCLDLLDRSGLVMQGWIDNALYYPDLGLSGEIVKRIAALPAPKQWEAMEPVYPNNPLHSFVACRPDRPPDDYKIDFASPRFLAFVPLWRADAKFDAGTGQIVRPAGTANTSGDVTALVGGIDGKRTIAELIGRHDGVTVELCREVFGFLWRAGAVLFRLARRL